jgi:CRP/FNR family cyclic AMP-dependent transcriptional regulator
MKIVDSVGYLASGLVLATFCMRSMSGLRLVGLASNLAFIAYGYLGNLTPVLVLHAFLLPVNVCRLAQLLRTELPRKRVSEEQRVRRSSPRINP